MTTQRQTTKHEEEEDRTRAPRPAAGGLLPDRLLVGPPVVYGPPRPGDRPLSSDPFSDRLREALDSLPEGAIVPRVPDSGKPFRTTPSTRVDTHMTFQAACSCGEWWGPFRDEDEDASQDGDRHWNEAHRGE